MEFLQPGNNKHYTNNCDLVTRLTIVFACISMCSALVIWHECDFQIDGRIIDPIVHSTALCLNLQQLCFKCIFKSFPSATDGLELAKKIYISPEGYWIENWAKIPPVFANRWYFYFSMLVPKWCWKWFKYQNRKAFFFCFWSISLNRNHSWLK